MWPSFLNGLYIFDLTYEILNRCIRTICVGDDLRVSSLCVEALRLVGCVGLGSFLSTLAHGDLLGVRVGLWSAGNMSVVRISIYCRLYRI